jgi:hypothetical protein
MKPLYIIIFLYLVVISCGRKPDGEADANPQSRAFELERENFFTSLKKPDEIATLIPGITAFDASMLHDAARFRQYADNNVKAAANLGVYMADLNYCILFKERDASKQYFQAAYALSEAIQIEKSILTFLMIRYEKNMEQNDSVKAVVNQLFSQSTLGLQGTDRERLAGIAMAGYQIENLYLALTTLKSFSDVLTEEQALTKNQLLQFVLEQRGKIEVIYNFIRVNSDPSDPDKNPNYPFFDNALRELIVVYRNVSEADPKVDELSEKIDVVRNKIVNL